MISIVIPVFNEQENIDILCEKLSKEAIDWGCPIEVIFVNDGSTDATRDRIIAQQQSGFPATIIQFSRNFGHQAAISAGIQHANGEAVVVMDGDLQDPPQTVSQFIKHWENGYQVVYGIRVNRKEGMLLRFSDITLIILKKTSANLLCL